MSSLAFASPVQLLVAPAVPLVPAASPVAAPRPCGAPQASAAAMAAMAGSFVARRGLRLARAAKKSGKQPFSNKIRTFFGQIYALLSLPFGGAGNFTQVEQGSVGVVLRFGKFDRMLDPGRHQFNVAVEKVLFEVQNYQQALSNLVQVTMRTVVGENDLSEIFAQRPRLNARITELIDAATGPWGIEVSQAQQEAEAKLIQARAQRESASILAEASQARLPRDWGSNQQPGG
eukprot:Skav205968  [mRNA]  locus=scaffold442:742983:747199:+ [translate_table: standard]